MAYVQVYLTNHICKNTRRGPIYHSDLKDKDHFDEVFIYERFLYSGPEWYWVPPPSLVMKKNDQNVLFICTCKFYKRL